MARLKVHDPRRSRATFPIKSLDPQDFLVLEISDPHLIARKAGGLSTMGVAQPDGKVRILRKWSHMHEFECARCICLL